MNKTLLKFINYLDSSASEIERKVIERVNRREDKVLNSIDKVDVDRCTTRKQMSRILNVPRESWELYGELFADFATLSDLMMCAGLKNKEVFYIVFYLIEKNLGAHVLELTVRSFDIKKIENYNFSSYKYLNKDVILEMVRTEQYGRLASMEEEELTDTERELLDEFERFSAENPEDLTGVVENHRLMKEHYFDKLDSFDREDIEVVCDVFRKMGLYESYVEVVRDLLESKLEKRSKKDSPIIVERVQVREKKDVLTDKEYNLLSRELRKYFDVSKMVVVEPINLEIEIYCVSLMIRMGFDDTTIKRALKVMNKSLVQEENPIVVFTKLYSKLMYYENIPDIKEAVDNIMSYLVEMFIINDEDYEVLKEFIGEEINKIQDSLMGTFDYEMAEASKLSKGMK